MEWSAANDFLIPRGEPVMPRIDAAMTNFDFELDEFVDEVNHLRRERSLRLLDGFIAAVEAEIEAHAHLYEPLTSDSEMLNIYGRQLLANHRLLRGELASLTLSRTWTEQLIAGDAEE